MEMNNANGDYHEEIPGNNKETTKLGDQNNLRNSVQLFWANKLIVPGLLIGDKN